MPARAAPPAEEISSFDRKVGRLVELSAGAGHDAFEDVAWDDAAFTVAPTDPRLAPYPFDPLVRTEWYQHRSGEERARVGLQRTATAMRIGWEFENLLQQGLLIRAYGMDNADPAFAYAHYEVVEESQHSMMFHEFVRRTGPEVRGMPRALRWLAQPLVQVSSRRFPELFFVLVLGGEIPIDYLQRRALREVDLHPLVRRIMAIHVEEEARHVSYANLELRRRVPRLGLLRRHTLALATPLVLGVMARQMVFPSRWLRAVNGIEPADARAALRHPESRQLLADSVARIRSLCSELRLLPPVARRLWRVTGLWGTGRTAATGGEPNS